MTIVVTLPQLHAPYYVALVNNTIADNAPIGTSVGRLDSYDVDSSIFPQTFAYSLGTGGDNSAFKIVGNQLVTNASFAAAGKQFFQIQVTSTENSSGLSTTAAFTVIVTIPQYHAPYAVALENTTISNNTPIGTFVGRLDTYDVDSTVFPQTFTYSLGTGGDNSAFKIVGNQLVTNALFSTSSQQYYHIQVTSTEGASGLSTTVPLTVVVTMPPNPHAPYAVTLVNNTIPYIAPVGSNVGRIDSYDVDSNATFTYSLGSGGDNSAFKIVGNELVTNALFSASRQAYYHIQITSTENGSGLSATFSFTVVINPPTPTAAAVLNPVSIGLSSDTVSGTLAIGDLWDL
jgi:hypothetical protein